MRRRNRSSEKRPTAPAVCLNCGKSFDARTDSAGLYCTRQCCNTHRSGSLNGMYNGGLSFGGGRWLVVCRDGTTMLYSRAVMAAEIGRLLTPEEIVHHVNEDTTDDDPGNLEVETRASHLEIHRATMEQARRRSGMRIGRGYIQV